MLKIDQLKAFSLTKLDFNHKATMTYGKRIGFVKEDDKGLIKTNPRNIIGKIGIACHPVFIKGKTIKVEVQMLNAEKKIVYLNKKSAIKWLNSQLPEYQKLSKKASDQEIIDTINHLGDMLGDLKDLPDLVASEPHSGSSEEEPIADANRMQNLPQNEPIAGGGEKENIFGEQIG